MAANMPALRTQRAVRLFCPLRSFSSTVSVARLAAPAPSSAIGDLLKALKKVEQRNPQSKGSMLQRNPRSTRPGPYNPANEDLEAARLAEISKLNKRIWKTGDVYAPHDLSPVESRKWRARMTPDEDMFDRLQISPLNEWKNPAMMGEFQTEMGKIKKRSETGLRQVNQRRIARAIKRGIGMGFLPSVHLHPELLRRQKAPRFA